MFFFCFFFAAYKLLLQHKNLTEQLAVLLSQLHMMYPPSSRVLLKYLLLNILIFCGLWLVLVMSSITRPCSHTWNLLQWVGTVCLNLHNLLTSIIVFSSSITTPQVEGKWPMQTHAVIGPGELWLWLKLLTVLIMFPRSTYLCLSCFLILQGLPCSYTIKLSCIFRSQLEGKVVKPLSAGCVNIVAAYFLPWSFFLSTGDVMCLQPWTAWITLDPVHEFHLYACLGQNYEISIQPAKAIRAYEHAVEIAHSCSEQRWKQSTDPEIVAIYLGNLYRWRTTSYSPQLNISQLLLYAAAWEWG